MELNSQETNVYVKYKRKIDEIWQDQVDAGATFGRADLREVFGAFKSLKEKIEKDPDLSQEYKNELLGIIINKMDLAKDREEEVLKAEESYTIEKNEAFLRAIDRFKKLPIKEQEKYTILNKKIQNGYHIFLTVEELDSVFKGEVSYDKLKERISEEYPIISQDLKPEIEKTEEKIATRQ